MTVTGNPKRHSLVRLLWTSKRIQRRFFPWTFRFHVNSQSNVNLHAHMNIRGCAYFFISFYYYYFIKTSHAIISVIESTLDWISISVHVALNGHKLITLFVCWCSALNGSGIKCAVVSLIGFAHFQISIPTKEASFCELNGSFVTMGDFCLLTYHVRSLRTIQ